MLESPTEIAPLPSGVFQQDVCIGRLPVDCIDGFGNPLQPLRFRAGRKRTGVHYNVRNSQHTRPLQLDHHGVNRLLPQLVLGRAEVDQVGTVRKRELNLQLFQRGLKTLCILFGNLLRPPLIVVLRKQLHTIATAVARDLNGFVVAARHRHMGAKNCQCVFLRFVRIGCEATILLNHEQKSPGLNDGVFIACEHAGLLTAVDFLRADLYCFAEDDSAPLRHS